jgi:hypothetical protein
MRKRTAAPGRGERSWRSKSLEVRLPLQNKRTISVTVPRVAASAAAASHARTRQEGGEVERKEGSDVCAGRGSSWGSRRCGGGIVGARRGRDKGGIFACGRAEILESGRDGSGVGDVWGS